MDQRNWTWAELSGDKLNLLKEAEQTLGSGVDILLAFQQNKPISQAIGQVEQTEFRVSNLNDSQVECLQGMEEKLQAVVIAYQQGAR